jgi:hypothetical protein
MKRLSRGTRDRSVLLLVLRGAESGRSDEELLENVAADAVRRPDDARRALALLATQRDRFEMDRAYRILSAAIHGNSVEPVPQDRRELFARERDLGRMPIAQAFAMLADRRPRLSAAASVAASSSEIESVLRARRQAVRAGQLLAGLPGEDDALLETDLARSIVEQYLAILDGSVSADPSTPYFDLPQKKWFCPHGLALPRVSRRPTSAIKLGVDRSEQPGFGGSAELSSRGAQHRGGLLVERKSSRPGTHGASQAPVWRGIEIEMPRLSRRCY